MTVRAKKAPRLNLVDSCGWLEYFADAPGASFFAPALEEPASLLVPTICLLEVFKRIVRQRDEEAALTATTAMRQGKVVDLDASLALEAARLGLAHSLPLADSVILATAQAHDALLWTSDADFAGIAGVRFFGKRNV